MKKISLSPRSFFIGAGAGTLLGLLLMGIFVHYLISSARSGTATSGVFLGGTIEQVRNGMQYEEHLKAATTAYGRVISLQGGVLVLGVTHTTDDVRQVTFVYDDATVFVSIANDANSTEVPLSSDTIMPGDTITVLVDEAVGSVANQHAVKIIKI